MLTRVRKVYQTATTVRGNCCFPACLSSLTGIPMREIPYDDKTDCWQSDMNGFLNTRGFSLTRLDRYKIHDDKLYIMIDEYLRGGAHAMVSRGTKVVHDPATFLRKNTKDHSRMTIKQYFLEIKNDQGNERDD